MIRVLETESDDAWKVFIRKVLSRSCEVVGASGYRSMLRRLKRENFDIVILEIDPPDLGLCDLLKKIQAVATYTDVIVTSRKAEVEPAVKAIQDGATEERSFWTKSRNCRLRFRRSFCGLSRRRSSRGSEETERSERISGSSQLLTGNWKAWWPRGLSGPTSSIVSTYSGYTCLHCVNGGY